MRHGKKINHLGRTSSHRKAMLANMAISLIMHKRITTTLAKGKALRKYIEPLITRAKSNSLHSRRIVFSYLQNKQALSELFDVIGEKVADRPGGYTRIIKMGNRLGDNADMCMIELVDYNELLLSDSSGSKTRRRRRKKKDTSEEQQPVAEATAVEESDVSEGSDAEDNTEGSEVKKEKESE